MMIVRGSFGRARLVRIKWNAQDQWLEPLIGYEDENNNNSETLTRRTAQCGFSLWSGLDRLERELWVLKGR